MKPKISVVNITLGRSTLYNLIEKLLNQKIDCEYEIVLIPQDLLKEQFLKDRRIRIHYEPLGEGVSYPRNVGVNYSEGEIIVFIDDDEEPIDEYWLRKLSLPIIEGKELATTAGYYIPLGQGYLADSISFLGFPGGGYVGFKTMWNVDERGYTAHLCTGNFAIKKCALKEIGGFNENLKFGTEDVELAEKLRGQFIKIRYIESATVLHESRTGFVNFAKWNIKRGRSIYEFKKLKRLKGKYVNERLNSFKKIMKKSIFTKYFPMVLFLFVSQYFFNLLGYLKEAYCEK